MTRTSVTADAVRGDEVTAATDAQYVYDVYYMNKQAFEWSALENIVTVEAFHQDELEYVDDRANECEEVYDDEDDSNDEDNWRNDYPDEDPRFFENEDCEYRYGDGTTCRVGCLSSSSLRCQICLTFGVQKVVLCILMGIIHRHLK